MRNQPYNGPEKRELRELSVHDAAPELYDMIQEIGPGENGFNNGLFQVPWERYPEELAKLVKMAQGVDLPPNRVPQTIYWLYADGRPMGYGKLRPQLNEQLWQSGGHIGYVIRPAERGRGWSKVLLHGLLEKAREAGLHEVLLTCNADNAPSRRTIEANGGTLDSLEEGKCKYGIILP